jgi:hypothetical protein
MPFDLSSVGAPIDERYSNDMAVQAIDLMEAARPGLAMRNASPEVVLIEALALAAADVSNAANQAVAELAELLLANFYEVPRMPGVPAVGAVTVTFDDAISTTIPTGTGFVLSEFGIEVAATADVVVAGSDTAVVQVASVQPTTLINGVGPGAAVDILDVIPNALSVAVSTAFGSGVDIEDDLTYQARARVRLARVTNSLVVPDHFSAYCLEDGRAVNAATIRAWDGTGTAPAPGAGTDAGEVTVITYGRGGNLSETTRDELAAAMQSITAAGITVHVNPATVTSVAVTATVSAAPGYAATEVQDAAVAAVQAFLNPETWPIGTDVAVGAIEAAMVDTPQVQFVVSTDAPAADVTIAPDAIASAGTITVSVT